MAKMTFIYGAMNSGKSLELLSAANNYDERQIPYLSMKSAVDTKGGPLITSRIGIERPVDIIAPTDINVRHRVLEEIELRKLGSIGALLVDEAQFLPREQVFQLFELVKEDDIAVLATGLRTDFEGKPFEGSTAFMTLGDDLKEKTTVCRCGRKARMNARLINGLYVFTGEQVAIDGDAVAYEGLCAEDWLLERAKSLAT